MCRLRWPVHQISIHALLAESDCGPLVVSVPVADFYPRSPCGERPSRRRVSGSNSAFLSTLSLRRATLRSSASCWACCNFYPRSPCGERPALPGKAVTTRDFYPRSPCGERPTANTGATKSDQISIHALLAESDRSNQTIISQANDFYPRSPCGERHCE